ncbi:MAG: IS3 family transposase [Gemmatimonadetes bacterium]|nr:IS3 family transposase [Gemmatimonadota bacterium]
MKAHRALFPIAAMCRVLRLSRSGYYDWLKRPPSARAQRDLELQALILPVWTGSKETYGAPRIHAALRAAGERVSRKRVARLMQGLGIQGVTRRRPSTAMRRKIAQARYAPDLVKRDFSADGPNQLWVADITQVSIRYGWLYLAVVLDVWSRRIVGWATESHPRTELVETALAKAVSNRKPEGGLIHHSDRGVQYTSLAFATLRCELIHRRRFAPGWNAWHEIRNYIENFYNTRRIHSAIGYNSPADFEKLNHAA